MVHGISPTVFDQMVSVRGIASKSIDPKYWVHGIVLLWFWTMVLCYYGFGPWYYERLAYKRERRSLG